MFYRCGSCFINAVTNIEERWKKVLQRDILDLEENNGILCSGVVYDVWRQWDDSELCSWRDRWVQDTARAGMGNFLNGGPQLS